MGFSSPSLVTCHAVEVHITHLKVPVQLENLHHQPRVGAAQLQAAVWVFENLKKNQTESNLIFFYSTQSLSSAVSSGSSVASSSGSDLFTTPIRSVSIRKKANISNRIEHKTLIHVCFSLFRNRFHDQFFTNECEKWEIWKDKLKMNCYFWRLSKEWTE